MKKQTILPEIFTKKKLQLAVAVLVSFALSDQLNAQTCSSYNGNSVPILGLGNCAFGIGALTSASSFSTTNVAMGSSSLSHNTVGSDNTAIGDAALSSNETGNENSAVGSKALYNNIAHGNSAIGYQTLYLNTTGGYNVASGFSALYTNRTGSNNVAVGANALYFNSVGGNTAIGYNALYSNTTGVNNVATGYEALYSNTTGRDNTANGGYSALRSNTTGSYNTASGSYALTSNVSGFYNSAYGYQALQGNTAANNTSTGFRSLYLNTTGANNTASGFTALYNNGSGANNTGIGSAADVGSSALSNATAIGSGAVVNTSNKVRIGNTSVTVIEGQVPFTSISDGRFKTNVKEEDVKGLEFIKKLRPVVYNLDTKKLTEFWTKNMPDSMSKRYINQDFAATTGIRQSGFIAQEVESAAKAVNYNFNGVHVPENENDNYGLAYSQFVVPLVKATQEQQKMIEDQKKMLDDQMQMIANLQQQINDLQKAQGSTTGLGRISMNGSYMEQNVPNPFSRETVIRFNLAGQFNNAYMAIYDLSGKQLKTIPIIQHGTSSITINADQLAPGMYIYSLMVDGNLLDSKRMVVADK